MEALVDAMTGQVLSFEDTVDYLQAVGDVFPFSNDRIDARGSLQDGWPMPFMEVGSATTDSGGNYALAGSQMARLTGPYVEMRDRESNLFCISTLVPGTDTFLCVAKSISSFLFNFRVRYRIH